MVIYGSGNQLVIPPGVDSKEALEIANSQITAEMEGHTPESEMWGLDDPTFRQVNNVYIVDAIYNGREKYHLYISRNPSDAKRVAEAELSIFKTHNDQMKSLVGR